MNARALEEIWVYLGTSPLLYLTLTIAAYVLGDLVYRRSGRWPLLNPVLTSILFLVALLTVTRTPYPVYFDGAQFVHFLLGPATVALAVPLYFNFWKLKRLWLPLSVGLVSGAATAAVSAVGIAWILDASAQTALALAPKSVTAPVAMAIAEKMGGSPSLTAILVVTTGILGAMLGPAVLDFVRVRDPAARGFAIGTASHGIGTARAFQESEEAGAFSGLAMGLNALLSALILPPILRVVGLVY